MVGTVKIIVVVDGMVKGVVVEEEIETVVTMATLVDQTDTRIKILI